MGRLREETRALRLLTQQAVEERAKLAAKALVCSQPCCHNCLEHSPCMPAVCACTGIMEALCSPRSGQDIARKVMLPCGWAREQFSMTLLESYKASYMWRAAMSCLVRGSLYLTQGMPAS